MERLDRPPTFANRIGVETVSSVLIATTRKMPRIAEIGEAAALGNLARLRVIRGVDPLNRV